MKKDHRPRVRCKECRRKIRVDKGHFIEHIRGGPSGGGWNGPNNEWGSSCKGSNQKVDHKTLNMIFFLTEDGVIYPDNLDGSRKGEYINVNDTVGRDFHWTPAAIEQRDKLNYDLES